MKSCLAILCLLILCSCGGGEEYRAAKQRDGRFLCAANIANLIPQEARLEKEEPYYSGIGFKDEPKVFVAGPSGIYACVVGKTDDGVLVAFRGTSAPSRVDHASFTDWLNNLISLEPVQPAGFSGKVHPKFWKAVEELWPGVMAEIEKRANENGKALPVYLTGHGKGGAIAVLFGMKMHYESPLKASEIITFGAPMMGDTTFAARDAGHVNVIRYVVEGDIVPLLPPDMTFIRIMETNEDFAPVFDRAFDWNYNEFGREIFLAVTKGDKKQRPKVMLQARKQQLAGEIAKGQEGFEKIVGRHHCGCGTPYWKLLAEDLHCPVKTDTAP